MILTSIFLTLIVSILLILLISVENEKLVKQISLICTSIVLFLSTILVINFDINMSNFQYLINLNFGSENLNNQYILGLDGISILFFYLSSLLIFGCILFIWRDNRFRFYAINLLLIEIFLLLVFSVLDLFLFYVFFEAILIPMYLIIGIWGSRERKIRAVYLFFFYTLCGSILLLIGIIYIYNTVGSLNIEYLTNYNFTSLEQNFLWIAFFISFASKIPMFPFHIWLPEAHVEAPTVGSVLLAGILLKLGVYGFLRFSLGLFPESSLFFSPLVYILSIIGLLYASFNAIRQTDLKRIIAYSSIAHMNLVTIGIFSFNTLGIEGAILQSISHGFVSGGLFFLVGILYERYHSRSIYYYGGLVHFMPLYSIFLFLFTMANIALPGTSSFVGEFFILMGFYKVTFIGCVLSSLGIIVCGVYSLWLYNRIIFGNLKVEYTKGFLDISLREFFIMIPLLFLILIIGIRPSLLCDFIHSSVYSIFF